MSDSRDSKRGAVSVAEFAAARATLRSTRRWVIKIGSALLTANGRGLDTEAMSAWVAQVVELRRRGVEVVLVSSGAVAEGMLRLGLKQRPQLVHELQAAAAVGQMGLVQAYETYFHRFGLHTAQILLTHDDLSDRKRYLNARATLKELLRLGVIPVVNENDTVVTDEIRFGDNDTLGALVTNLVGAEMLLILTDQDALYQADPRHQPDAEVIHGALATDPHLLEIAGGSGTALGRGGMVTKVQAARLAARSGAMTLIAGGRLPHVILRLHEGEPLGTLLLPEQDPLAARKQWLAAHLQTRGDITIDAGAVRMLRECGKSLLPVGVKAISGTFSRGEMVVCSDEAGRSVARGLVNYGHEEAVKLIGQPSGRIAELIGYMGEPELIHRDNLVLL